MSLIDVLETARSKPRIERADLVEVFHLFDVDENGFISAQDLRKSGGVCGPLTDERIDRMIRKVDKDGNGQIGLEVFLDFFEQPHLLDSLNHDHRPKSQRIFDHPAWLDVSTFIESRSLEKSFRIQEIYRGGKSQKFLSFERFLEILGESSSSEAQRVFNLFATDGKLCLAHFLILCSNHQKSVYLEERMLFAFTLLKSQELGLNDLIPLIKLNYFPLDEEAYFKQAAEELIKFSARAYWNGGRQRISSKSVNYQILLAEHDDAVELLYPPWMLEYGEHIT